MKSNILRQSPPVYNPPVTPVISEEEDPFADLIDSTVDLPITSDSACEEDQHGFSRFRKIPIGTFWQSQRLPRKSKRKPLHSAVKRSPGQPLKLNSTLLDHTKPFSPPLVPTVSEIPISLKNDGYIFEPLPPHHFFME